MAKRVPYVNDAGLFPADLESRLRTSSAEHVKDEIESPGSPIASALSAAIVRKLPEVVYDAKLHGGLKGGGQDDTIAFADFLANVPTPTNTFGDVGVRLHFPAGRYVIGGSYVFNKRFTWSGDGPYQTILNRKPGAVGDFLTFNGSNSIIRDMTIDGNRHNGTTGDNLVLNGAYAAAEALTSTNSGANGITVGKSGSAILYRLDGVLVRDSVDHGVYVVPGSGSTDGQWVNVDVGRSGLNGVKISNGAQNLVNVHAWGSGLSATIAKDGVGILLDSSNNSLANCQGESNWSHGIASWTGTRNKIVGGSAWGNLQNGIYIFDSACGTLSGVAVFNNGVSNVDGSSSDVYAGIRNQGGTQWAITGCLGEDDAAAIPSPTYSAYAPINPYPGRTAVRTTAKHYVETAGTVDANWNSVSGNNWRSERTRNGVAVVTLGSSSVWAGNFLGGQPSPEVTSSATVTAPAWSALVKITGSATITRISPATPGRNLTLKFMASLSVIDGGNLELVGNYSPVAGSTLTLVSDGINWHEVGRSLSA